MKLLLFRIYFAVLLLVSFFFLLDVGVSEELKLQTTTEYVRMASILAGALFFWINYLLMRMGKPHARYTVLLACCIQSVGYILAATLF